MKKLVVKPTVKGLQLRFPIDMLRYDSCYPADQESVAKICYTLDNIKLGEHEEICLIAHYDVTPERWKSFGWTVVRTERR